MRVRRSAGLAGTVALVAVTMGVIALSAQLRWHLARTTSWQCDEIPLLVRCTGLCGQVSNEVEARAFAPSYYSFYMGALRSVAPPKYLTALHTTTAFWTNLTVHLFGCSPAAGRAGPLFWSMAAVVAVAWAAWLSCRSLVAVCVAAGVVALSPHAVASAAQARGYAEALALTPLLLVALELFRRRPDRWIRVLFVFLCALQLSLTVYTMWIYWVLPALVLSIIVVPRLVGEPQPPLAPPCQEGERGALATLRVPNLPVPTLRVPARASLILLTVALIAFMAIYTIDRWAYFRFLASHGGATLDQAAEVGRFARRLVERLFGDPAWLALIALVGVGSLWRSPVRWWLWSIGLGLLVPVVFTLMRGTPGYPRNLGHLLGPIAILCGAGVHGLLSLAGIAKPAASTKRAFAFNIGPHGGPYAVTAGVVAGLVLVGVSTWAYAGLERAARSIMPPDWGSVVRRIDQEPLTVGPRWFCGCLANHWQINWYRRPRDEGEFLRVPVGGRIEVVMGAQLDEEGKAKVFRVAKSGDGFVEQPVPDYVAATPPVETRWGVEVRRWCGTRVDEPAVSQTAPGSPVLILAVLKRTPDESQWERFWQESEAYRQGVVTFKAVGHLKTQIWSMIAPANAWPMIQRALKDHLNTPPRDIRCFMLSPLREPA